MTTARTIRVRPARRSDAAAVARLYYETVHAINRRGQSFTQFVMEKSLN